MGGSDPKVWASRLTWHKKSFLLGFHFLGAQKTLCYAAAAADSLTQ